MRSFKNYLQEWVSEKTIDNFISEYFLNWKQQYAEVLKYELGDLQSLKNIPSIQSQVSKVFHILLNVSRTRLVLYLPMMNYSPHELTDKEVVDEYLQKLYTTVEKAIHSEKIKSELITGLENDYKLKLEESKLVEHLYTIQKILKINLKNLSKGFQTIHEVKNNLKQIYSKYDHLFKGKTQNHVILPLTGISDGIDKHQLFRDIKNEFYDLAYNLTDLAGERIKDISQIFKAKSLEEISINFSFFKKKEQKWKKLTNKDISTFLNFVKNIVEDIDNTELKTNFIQLTQYIKDYKNIPEDLVLIISRNLKDILEMSTDRTKRHWTSCMRLSDNKESGQFVRYLKDELLNGILVGYLINKKDTSITNPFARILIKPYVNEKNEEIIMCTGKMYSVFEYKHLEENIYETVNDWLNKHQTYSPGTTYNLKSGSYREGKLSIKK